ncbi:IS4 family transposase [Vineibacter terrae]|uniref:IS4 family transposase n=1 Tax=Vineibacter terrae TaxID=2586908 RepID=A0A5C8P662_9HYPH|nr:IS4 family transposase [Vineibacter terrae]TXL69084.1 IS4 family transposase [Vineibacter terrae]
MVVRQTTCVRRLAQGCRSTQMGFWRFLANKRVTLDRVIEDWSTPTQGACAGRHVLAIQDTSEIKFATTKENRRGLGKVKKGTGHGVLLHPMLAVDADSGIVLGLAGGRAWTRSGAVTTPHSARQLADKESVRWVQTAEQAKQTLANARLITVIDDREGDIYAHWALTPAPNVHLITRLMNDHAVLEGGTVRTALAHQPVRDTARIELRDRADRPARTAQLSLRFTTLSLKRPKNTPDKDLSDSVPVHVVEVVEPHPPAGAEPLHWILLTTHAVNSLADAWQIVQWYRRRWIIEQFFRTLKRQGLRIEDSELATAERLLKLVAIAAKAAVIVMQLVQARDGHDDQPASLVFSPHEIKVLDILNSRLQGKTPRQRNPHPHHTMAAAAWVIAKLGGWHVYETKPPGPITFFNGLTYFRALAQGYALNDL